MCLVIKEGLLEIITAEQNIPVYKILDPSHRSINQNYKYKKGVVNNEPGALGKSRLNSETYYTYEEGIVKHEEVPFHQFDEGFHSWIKPSLNLFVIPKGTKYVIGGDNGLYSDKKDHDAHVSEAIIYVGPNNWFNRLKGKILYGVDFKPHQ